MFQEEWRDVVGWEGWYQVSNQGMIKRVHPFPKHRTGRVLVGSKHKAGYLQVMLSRAGKARMYLAHSLVMTAFIGPRPDGYEVNHINGLKDDNRLSNLEYVTSKENIAHARDVLGFKYGYHQRPKKRIQPRPVASHTGYKLSHEAAHEIRSLYEERKYSQVELGAMFGVSHTMIGRIVRGKAWVSSPVDRISSSVQRIVESAKEGGLSLEIANTEGGVSITINGLYWDGHNWFCIRE